MSESYQIILRLSDFVVVDKPAGWLTVPGRANDKDPRPCLGRRLEGDLGVRVFPVHRLDLEVSGLVLFALNAEAHRLANKWFESHVVRKVYDAFSEKGVAPAPQEAQIWKSLLVRGKKRTFRADHGLPAETVAHCLGPLAGSEDLHWRLEPVTGRSHQLRFEMAQHGFPLLGDSLYGAQSAWAAGGIALRAVELDFSRVSEADRRGLPAQLRVVGLTRSE